MRHLLVLVLTISLLGCGDSRTGVSTFINIGVSNSTTHELAVGIQVQIGEGSGTTLQVPPGYTSTELSGTSGNVVVFTVSGALTGSGSCTATNQIVGTSTYGEVNILEGANSTASITCLSGWAESGG